jgi:hypothetical protein
VTLAVVDVVWIAVQVLLPDGPYSNLYPPSAVRDVGQAKRREASTVIVFPCKLKVPGIVASHVIFRGNVVNGGPVTDIATLDVASIATTCQSYVLPGDRFTTSRSLMLVEVGGDGKCDTPFTITLYWTIGYTVATEAVHENVPP